MAKRSREKEEKRLWDNGFASLSEQERAVTENRELRLELEKLRINYVIDFRNLQDHVAWMDSQSRDTLIKFSTDVESLKTKYKINDRINEKFWEVLWNIPPQHEYVTKRKLGGMPRWHFSKELGHVLLITPETDIKNELVLEFMVTWQKSHFDSPPQPQEIKDSKRLDWRPVWEWSLRHPQITRKEIADRLQRNYTEVKRKLEGLDKQIENPPLLYFQK